MLGPIIGTDLLALLVATSCAFFITPLGTMAAGVRPRGTGLPMTPEFYIAKGSDEEDFEKHSYYSVCFQAGVPLAGMPGANLELSPAFGVSLSVKGSDVTMSLDTVLGAGLSFGVPGFTFCSIAATVAISGKGKIELPDVIEAARQDDEEQIDQGDDSRRMKIVDYVRDSMKATVVSVLKDMAAVKRIYDGFANFLKRLKPLTSNPKIPYNIKLYQATREARMEALWLKRINNVGASDKAHPYYMLGQCENVVAKLRKKNVHKIGEYCDEAEKQKGKGPLEWAFTADYSKVLRDFNELTNVFRDTSNFCDDPEWVKEKANEYILHCELLFGFGKLLPGTLFENGVATSEGKKTVGRRGGVRLDGLANLENQLLLANRTNDELRAISNWLHWSLMRRIVQNLWSDTGGKDKRPDDDRLFAATARAWFQVYTDVGEDVIRSFKKTSSNPSNPCAIQDDNVLTSLMPDDKAKKAFGINQDPSNYQNVILRHGITAVRRLICIYFQKGGQSAKTKIADMISDIYLRDDRLGDTQRWWSETSSSEFEMARKMYKAFAVVDELEPGVRKPTTKEGNTVIEIPEDTSMNQAKGYHGFISISETRLKWECAFLFESPDRIEQHLIDIASLPDGNNKTPLLKWNIDSLEVEATLVATMFGSEVGYCTPDHNPIQIVAAKKLTITSFRPYKSEWSNLQVVSTVVFPLVPDMVWMYLDLELQASKAEETLGFGFRFLFSSPTAKEIPDSLGEGVCKYLAGPMQNVVGSVLREIVSDLLSKGDYEQTTQAASSVSAAKDRFKATLQKFRQAFEDLLEETAKKGSEPTVNDAKDKAVDWLTNKIQELIDGNTFLRLAQILANKVVKLVTPAEITENNYIEVGYHIPPGAWSTSDGSGDIGGLIFFR